MAPLQVRAKKDYVADDPDEYLSLEKGKVYWQLSPAEDGWVQGCAVSDPQKLGLFPQVGRHSVPVRSGCARIIVRPSACSSMCTSACKRRKVAIARVALCKRSGAF